MPRPWQLKSQSRRPDNRPPAARTTSCKAASATPCRTMPKAATLQSSASNSATQDWWFQHQRQQQTAQRPSTDYAMAAPRGRVEQFGSGKSAPARHDGRYPVAHLAARPVLRVGADDDRRPYRRNPPTAERSGLPADGQRRRGHESRLAMAASEGVDTNQYNAAKAFLNKLGGEMASHIK